MASLLRGRGRPLQVRVLSLISLLATTVVFISWESGLFTLSGRGRTLTRRLLDLSIPGASAPEFSPPYDCLLHGMALYLQSMCSNHHDAETWPATYQSMKDILNAGIYPNTPKREAFMVGYEAWDWETVNEMHTAFNCKEFPFPPRQNNVYPPYNLTAFPIHDGLYLEPRIPELVPPIIYATYSNAVLDRKKFQSVVYQDYLGFSPSKIHWTNFGEKENILPEKEWIAKRVFRNATSMNVEEYTHHNMLSTLTAFKFIEKLANSTEEYALYIEDDMRPVFRFWDKWKVMMTEIQELHPKWDMVITGKCRYSR